MLHELFFRNLNLLLAPIVGLIVILFDCWKKCYADSTMRRLMGMLIVFSLIPMTSELLFNAIMGFEGKFFHIVSWIANITYFLSQFMSFVILAIFLDYCIYTDNARTKRLFFIAIALLAAEVFMLIYTVITGAMFTITHDNIYVRGEYYIALICLGYIIELFAVINAFFMYRHMHRSQVRLVLGAAVMPAIGVVFDVAFDGLWLVWPCIFISILLCYLFIVRVNVLIDSLTGVHNRRSCDEFLTELSKLSRRKDYTFVMVDLDKLKYINDTFGHSQGDQAISDAGEVLRASVRRTDYVARYGGDEFIIIAATGEHKKVSANINAKLLEFNAKKLRQYELAFSCGAAVYTQDNTTQTPIEFLSYVDKLMFANKNERRSSGQ